MTNRNDDRNDDQRGRTEIVRRIDPRELGLPEGPTTDTALIQDALAHALAQGCNVLAPPTRIQSLPPDHQLSICVVAFDVDGGWNGKSNDSFYQVDGGKVALHKASLNKLAAAAGLSDVPEHCKVEQVEPSFWRASHCVEGKLYDGTVIRRVGTVEVDLRDGSAEAAKAGRGLRNARVFGARNAETKAALRAIRSWLSLQGSYTRDQARQPFVFPRLRWVPDLSDPIIKRMVAAKELGIVDALYGSLGDVTPTLIADAPAATGDPDWAGDAKPDPEPEQRQTGAPPCYKCQRPLSDQEASDSIDAHGAALCYDHRPRGGGR